jgi:hypothetical protein
MLAICSPGSSCTWVGPSKLYGVARCPHVACSCLKAPTWIGIACFHQGFSRCPDDGWWRTPNHSTPETLGLTAPPAPPMLGISGLLNLLTWVEHRQLAQAAPHEEGGIPCPVSHPTRLPPTRFQTGNQSVGSSAPGQSTAAPLEAPSSARTPAGSEQRTRQGGRR